MSVYLILDLV
jgi:hypothetical protein